MSAETEEVFLGIGRGYNLSWQSESPEDDEIRRRFYDIKEELRRQESFEITNEYVMSVLTDLYWIHHENGGEHE